MIKSVKISGIVLDKSTGKPLELGSRVYLSDHKGKSIDSVETQTNDNGYFQLDVPLVSYGNPMNPSIPILLPKGSHLTFRPLALGSHKQKTIPLDKSVKTYNVDLIPEGIGVNQEVEGVDIVAKRKVPETKKNNTLLYVGVGALALVLIGTGYYGHSKGWFKS